jgi:hypothetical protein
MGFLAESDDFHLKQFEILVGSCFCVGAHRTTENFARKIVARGQKAV